MHSLCFSLFLFRTAFLVIVPGYLFLGYSLYLVLLGLCLGSGFLTALFGFGVTFVGLLVVVCLRVVVAQANPCFKTCLIILQNLLIIKTSFLEIAHLHIHLGPETKALLILTINLQHIINSFHGLTNIVYLIISNR